MQNFPLQFTELTEDDFAQPGKAEAKKKHLLEAEKSSGITRKWKKGSSASEPFVIYDDALGVKIAKTT